MGQTDGLREGAGCTLRSTGHGRGERGSTDERDSGRKGGLSSGTNARVRKSFLEDARWLATATAACVNDRIASRGLARCPPGTGVVRHGEDGRETADGDVPGGSNQSLGLLRRATFWRLIGSK